MEITMRLDKFAAAFVLATLMSAAHPHGQPKAQHGGVVASANDLSFELVPRGERTALYLYDHDKPLDAQAYSGKLTVLSGTQKSEAGLTPAGANRLDAAIGVAKGARVVATLTGSDKKSLTVRFVVK